MHADALFVGHVDHAHFAHRIARALRTHGFGAYALVRRPHPFGYPRDPAPKVQHVESIGWLATTGDESRVFDVLRKHLPKPQRGVIALHVGSAFRDNPKSCLARDVERGAKARFYGFDLIRFDDGALPAFPLTVPAAHTGVAPVYDEPPLRIAHAPSRRSTKGTEAVLEAVDGLFGVELDLIEGLPFAECVERRNRAHVVVDQLAPNIGGFGTTSVEALSAGQVVLADTRNCKSHLQFPMPPIVNVRSADQLRQHLELLRNRPATVARIRAEGQRWCENVGAPHEVARYWLSCLEAL